MPCPAGRRVLACTLGLLLLLAPGCVMGHFRRNHLHPFTSETTTVQDVVYVGEYVGSIALAIATLGLVAPHEADGTLWNDLEWSCDDDDDDDAGCAGGDRREAEPMRERRSRERRVVGQRRRR